MLIRLSLFFLKYQLSPLIQHRKNVIIDFTHDARYLFWKRFNLGLLG